MCRRLRVIGVHRDGGFSQYACVPENSAYVVPAGLALPSAAIIEPFAVAANASHRTGVFDSDTALIYRAGPVDCRGVGGAFDIAERQPRSSSRLLLDFVQKC